MKGYRDTTFGQQKLMFMCGPGGSLQAVAMFDPQGHQEEIPDMGAVSFTIDSETIPMPYNRLVTKPEIVKGWADVGFALDGGLIRRLATAKTVGVTLQFTYQAPFFFGIGDMDFSTRCTDAPWLSEILSLSPTQRLHLPKGSTW